MMSDDNSTRAQMLREGVPWRGMTPANDAVFGGGGEGTCPAAPLAQACAAAAPPDIRDAQFIYIRMDAGIRAPCGGNTRAKPAIGGRAVVREPGDTTVRVVHTTYRVCWIGKKTVQLLRSGDSDATGMTWGPKNLLIPIPDFHHANGISAGWMD